jgi:hypothetical protein
MPNNKKGIRNRPKINYNTTEAGAMSISNPQFIPYQFNSFFVEVAGKMVNQNKDCNPDYVPVCKNNSFPNLLLNVTNNLKGKLSAGYDDIPEKIVKLSIQSFKKIINLYI